MISSAAAADDSFSASQLRQRYLRGQGNNSKEMLRDSELSASQVRARYGIQNHAHGKSDEKLVSLLFSSSWGIVVPVALLFLAIIVGRIMV